MPRLPGPINNEFLPPESDGKSLLVRCKHCRTARVTKGSTKRKIAHLRKCPQYRAKHGTFPFDNLDDGAEDTGIDPLPARQSNGSTVVAEPYHWPADGRLLPDNTALLVVDVQRDFCSQGGFLDARGFATMQHRAIIPPIAQLMHACRMATVATFHARLSHRHDLSTLTAADRARLRASLAEQQDPHEQLMPGITAYATNGGISTTDNSDKPPVEPSPGEPGPLGHYLLRQSAGTDPVPDLQPLYHEAVLDHPRPSVFAHTDLDLLLRNRGVRNLLVVGLSVHGSVRDTARDAADRGYDVCIVEGCVAPLELRSKPSTDSAAETRDRLLPDDLHDLSSSESAAASAIDAVLPPGSRRAVNGPSVGAIAKLKDVVDALTPFTQTTRRASSHAQQQQQQQGPSQNGTQAPLRFKPHPMFTASPMARVATMQQLLQPTPAHPLPPSSFSPPTRTAQRRDGKRAAAASGSSRPTVVRDVFRFYDPPAPAAGNAPSVGGTGAATHADPRVGAGPSEGPGGRGGAEGGVAGDGGRAKKRPRTTIMQRPRRSGIDNLVFYQGPPPQSLHPQQKQPQQQAHGPGPRQFPRCFTAAASSNPVYGEEVDDDDDDDSDDDNDDNNDDDDDDDGSDGGEGADGADALDRRRREAEAGGLLTQWIKGETDGVDGGEQRGSRGAGEVMDEDEDEVEDEADMAEEEEEDEEEDDDEGGVR